MLYHQLAEQHELLKIAIQSTDNYLGIIKYARDGGDVNREVYEQYCEYVKQSADALLQLGMYTDMAIYVHEYNTEITECYQSQHPMAEAFTSFKSFISEDEINEDEVDEIVNSICWDDIVDLYDEDELVYDEDGDDTFCKGEIEEKISAQSRLKRSQAMRRRTPRLTLARNMKLRRTSSMDVLKKRAVNAARRAVYKKLLMGRSKQQLSPGEKDRLEQRMKGMRYMQAAIAIKMLPKLKTIEQGRLAHKPVLKKR